MLPFGSVGVLLGAVACSRSRDPQVWEVRPAQAPAHQATPAAVLGRNFYLRARLALDQGVAVQSNTPWAIAIDEVAVSPVQRISAERLEFVIPAGLSPGPHRVTVVGPGGRVFPLGLALTVEQPEAERSQAPVDGGRSSPESPLEGPAGDAEVAEGVGGDAPGDAGAVAVSAPRDSGLPPTAAAIPDASSGLPAVPQDSGATSRDAGTLCPVFATPELLSGLGLSGALFGPTFGPDPLYMTFARYASSETIMLSKRGARDSVFALAEAAPGLVSDASDGTPFLSADGLGIYFYSTRPGGVGARDIWQAERATPEGAWANVRRVQNINSTAIDHLPTLPADELEIFFCSERSGGQGGNDLWRAVRDDPRDDFDLPQPLDELNSSSKECGPHLSADGLTLYFSSDRPGGVGNNDFWVTRRPGRGDPFGVPVLVEGVNSTADEIDFALTADGREVFFSSNRGGSSELYRAERNCP